MPAGRSACWRERAELARLRRENRVLREEREILNTKPRLLRHGDDAVSLYRFIATEKSAIRACTLCRTMGVSRSGFYSWAARPPWARRREDNDLVERPRRVHQMSRLGPHVMSGGTGTRPLHG